ncbi:cytochrome o ubiquinol oxidase subunit III [Moellerella wisconsensis]|uniref:Cytochrome bo(3) ubiquinol oxidase subunit 3 n=2 Tax=Moellerella wisconsensis TaxID=158849 RepID=A0A9Q8PZS8_9GAMM|nr:cytochrome o ubiquinol oxidase subunit III [Moellerella wisconsensis]KLN96460.1 cytochrome o ubiquinol oxidase subunit III [Moellerella wisconsensis]UNH23692.1 cytochrome o ubiquinol oxidase subunit III [Moellerella wisconsensis]UNH26780.1 cytochrome o ubiquinol oxidase subunit III [Moellerella wisconsensis]UNH30264.1 cytochrome o ubiquinol oxidase subunit III [Moellerella wisconsensis]UNH38423.1 cytochrome o ubiquinol oxidase subunit III [Moellerella wisconsensis]
MSTNTMTNQNEAHAEHGHHDAGATKVFGFWIYLMSDLILFASLFATYVVLSGGTAGGPSGKDIFSLKFVLGETFLLLFSSITYGFAMLAMHKGKVATVNLWLFVTFLLGLGFVIMEVYEFHELISEDYGPDRSGFLSAFFALVATHGLHVTAGLVWIIIMMIQVSCRGLTQVNQTRLNCLSLFWHFLDVVWICVFTVVYLLGAI